MREGEGVAASNTIDDGAKSYFCLLVIVFQHNGFHRICSKEWNERRGRATRRIIMMMNNTKKLDGLKL